MGLTGHLVRLWVYDGNTAAENQANSRADDWADHLLRCETTQYYTDVQGVLPVKFDPSYDYDAEGVVTPTHFPSDLVIPVKYVGTQNNENRYVCRVSVDKMNAGTVSEQDMDLVVRWGTVKSVDQTALDLSTNTVTLEAGQTQDVTAKLVGSQEYDISWKSGSDKVATVQNGTITAVGEGTTKIAVTADPSGFSDADSLTRVITVTVTKAPTDPNAEAAAAVDAQISAIGDVTLDSEAAITAARAAYDALTKEQKALVTKLDVLEAAEARLAVLKKPAVPEGVGSMTVTMMHEYKDQPSMCDIMFDAKASVAVQGDTATVKVLVANPVPGFPDQGADGTVKNVVISYNGKEYPAESALKTDAVMTAKATNPTFGFEKDKQYPAQVLTFTLPKEALNEASLTVNAYVNVVMMTDVVFRMAISDLTLEESKPAPEMNVSDVQKGDWFYPSVEYVYQNGMMNGITDTLFKPNANTTRAQIVTILYRLEGEPQADPCSFTDVAEGQWFFKEVSWAAANGIVNGYPDGSFGPNKDISREQMAAILYRYAQAKGYDLTADADLSGFADAGQINNYAKTAMSWAVTQGLMNGVEDTRIAPKGQATRAQIATLFMRFNETFVK